MSDLQTYHWRAEGRSIEIIERFFADKRAAVEAALAWRAQITDREDVAVMSGGTGRVLGLRPESSAARTDLNSLPFLRFEKSGRVANRCFVPRVRGNERGSALRKQANAIAIPGPRHLHERLYGRKPDFRFVKGGAHMESAGAEQIGDAWVIETMVDEAPPDAVRLKMSELWALREAQEVTP